MKKWFKFRGKKNCSKRQNDNYTVLHYASKDGWFEIVQSLLNKGADIQGKTKNGESPLLLAAANKHKDIVDLLLNAGADINCSDVKENFTVLHHSSKNGWLDIVQSLLNKGADFQGKTKHGESPLLLAAANEHKDIVDLLLNAGADINCSDVKENFTVLHYSSRNGWLDIVQSLLNKGADFQGKTKNSESPLLLAAANERKDIVDLLLNAGADINCSDVKENFTALHYSSKHGWPDTVQSLLKKGANIEARSNKGETSLHIACKCLKDGCDKVAVHLINAGADVKVECNSGNSPLSNTIGFLSNYTLRIYKLLGSMDKVHDIKLICPLLIESGAYLKFMDHMRIKGSFLEEYILQDCELCSQAIINEFNHKDLPELYTHSMAYEVLPDIKNMRILNKTKVAWEVLQSVLHEMQVKGQCNVLEVRPKVLKILAFKSFLSYCENIKINRMIQVLTAE